MIYCDPSRELNFWRPTPSALLALGLRSHTDIPALKELEEWFDTQKEMQAIAKLDPYFERTSRLASRRLKREERRGTLGEFALEPDLPPLQRIPTEESGSDLFRSDGSDAAALSYRFESPQSVMEGCSAQRSTVGPGEKESRLAPLERFAVEPPLVRAGQKRKEIAKHGSSIDASHRSTSFSVILKQFLGHLRGVPLAGAAHIAAIKAVSRRLVMDRLFRRTSHLGL